MDIRMGKPTLNAWEIILVVGFMSQRYGERSPTDCRPVWEFPLQRGSASPLVRRENQNGFQAL